MRNVIVNYQEEKTAIIESNNSVKFIVQGRGYYPIPLSKFMRNLHQNNPSLFVDALKDGVEIDINDKGQRTLNGKLTPEIIKEVKLGMLKEKMHRFETVENKLPNWVLIDRLWKSFHDNAFTLMDVRRNIEFPNIKSKDHLRMWINGRLDKLAKLKILKKYHDESISKFYVYCFYPPWIKRFNENDPLEHYVKFKEGIIEMGGSI